MNKEVNRMIATGLVAVGVVAGVGAAVPNTTSEALCSDLVLSIEEPGVYDVEYMISYPFEGEETSHRGEIEVDILEPTRIGSTIMTDTSQEGSYFYLNAALPGSTDSVPLPETRIDLQTDVLAPGLISAVDVTLCANLSKNDE